MKTKILAAGLAAFSLALSGCGNITPPVQNGQNSTAITVNSSATDSKNSSEDESKIDEKKSAENAFVAEFFDTDITFTDVEDLTAEPMKNSGFESEKNVTNGVQKFTLKSKNGGAVRVRSDLCCALREQAHRSFRGFFECGYDGTTAV